MTSVRSVYLICEGTGCIMMTGEIDSGTAKEARRAARGIGWIRTVDGRDLCTRCAAKERS